MRRQKRLTVLPDNAGQFKLLLIFDRRDSRRDLDHEALRIRLGVMIGRHSQQIQRASNALNMLAGHMQVDRGG